MNRQSQFHQERLNSKIYFWVLQLVFQLSTVNFLLRWLLKLVVEIVETSWWSE